MLIFPEERCRIRILVANVAEVTFAGVMRRRYMTRERSFVLAQQPLWAENAPEPLVIVISVLLPPLVRRD